MNLFPVSMKHLKGNQKKFKISYAIDAWSPLKIPLRIFCYSISVQRRTQKIFNQFIKPLVNNKKKWVKIINDD